jgi:hypothetical protein
MNTTGVLPEVLAASISRVSRAEIDAVPVRSARSAFSASCAAIDVGETVVVGISSSSFVPAAGSTSSASTAADAD